MTRYLLPLLAALLLMGQDCKPAPPPPDVPPPPPPGSNPYCYGTPGEPSLFDRAYAAILGGEESTDRRATLREVMDGGYCSGVAYGPHVAITAGHCTFGATKVTAALGGYSEPPYFDFLEKRENPDYFSYRSSGNQGYGRANDVSVVKYGASRDGEASELPPPYVNKIFDPLNPAHASRCVRLTAQGWGRNETGSLQLRECEYEIDAVTDEYVRTNHEDAEACRIACNQQYAECGTSDACLMQFEECNRMCDIEACRICFGDSGGPLYAEMDNGELWVVGLAMWTGNQECSLYSTHVRLSAPATARVPQGMEAWVHETAAEFAQ